MYINRFSINQSIEMSLFKNTFCKHCLSTTIKVYACYKIKIEVSNRAARARRAGLGSAFVKYFNYGMITSINISGHRSGAVGLSLHPAS